MYNVPKSAYSHHILYRTTNTVNGKTYTGIHSTDDLEDGYLGSGVALLRAIRKYGRDKFRREVIAEADSREDLLKLERERVTEDVVRSEETYNISLGGRSTIDSMADLDDIAFRDHQSRAGKAGGRVSYDRIGDKTEWHRKGGKKAARIQKEKSIGWHDPEVIRRKNKAVSERFSGTVELWHPEATVYNKNQEGYVSGWCKRVNAGDERWDRLRGDGWRTTAEHRRRLGS